MAEIMAVIGLASSIATFIDMGFRIVKTCKEVLESGHGMTNEAYEMTLIVKDIDKKLDEFLQNSQKTQHREQEKEISGIVTECKKLAQELLLILGSLAMRENARSRVLEAGRTVVVGSKKKDDIVRLTSRLERLEKRFRYHVLERRAGDRHDGIMNELQNLKRMHERQEVHNSRLETLQADIARLLRSETSGEVSLAQCANSLASLTTKLVALENERELYRRQLEIIKSLYFPELKRRRDEIFDANSKTEKWLFDEKSTSFPKWLRCGNGVYWINGLAGSGKSTLMKFICKCPETGENLQVWSGDLELHTADYFFWNQGHPMQKSLHGLLQSLLYQMLRRMPNTVLDICGDRSGFEAWELGELKEALRLLLQRTDLDTRFCFFIDGLDEYNGNIHDVVDVVKSLAKSSHVKVCASSRSWSIFEESFTDPQKTLIVHEFTKDDMRTYVHDEIAENVNFKKLKSRDPNCESIIHEIALRARGVWLWVYLVTRDIRRALDSKEEYDTLETILNTVPPDLFAYFEAIIKRIESVHRKEMAKIFLVTVDAVGPLPLYSINFLNAQDREVQIRPSTTEETNLVCERWKDKLHNRCGDLLIIRKYVEGNPILHTRVDFLHRTVRDWLRDNFFDSLQRELGNDTFDPRVTLCEMSLCLLKVFPVNDFRDSINDIICLVDEILYYSHEIEKTSESTNHRLIDILDEMDRVNCQHAKAEKNHWTHARHAPRGGPLVKYTEGGNCNFLALAVQARLTTYVRNTLDKNPQAIKKYGRPLLDYAVRPKRVTPAALSYHTDRDSATIDIEMVRLLLGRGASPNDRVFICDHHTVWGLFMLSCFEWIRDSEDVDKALKSAWRETTELLIDFGADYDCFGGHYGPVFKDEGPLTVDEILTELFGEEQAYELGRRLNENQDKKSWSGWMWGKLKVIGIA